jgi:hypothetical protein
MIEFKKIWNEKFCTFVEGEKSFLAGKANDDKFDKHSHGQSSQFRSKEDRMFIAKNPNEM